MRRSSTFLLVVGIGVLPLVVALAFHVYLSHGVGVVWRHRTTTITETTEHRPQFPTPHRPISRVMGWWDFGKWGVPATLPPLDALVSAWVEVPQPGRIFVIESSQRVAVRIDTRPYTGGLVPAGRHLLEVSWTGALGQANLALDWKRKPTGYLDSIPTLALQPVTDSSAGQRAAVWVVALVLSGLFSILTAVAAAGGARARRAGTAAFLLALFITAAGVRLWDYDVVPEFRENGDELFATWNGWQLLHDGGTVGWSLWAGIYGSRVQHSKLSYFGLDWDIVRPYLEHPPLTHLLVGAAAHAGGAQQYTHARSRHTRLVPIALSLVSLALVFAIGRRLWPSGAAAYLAAIFYATLPIVAMHGRVIKEEAGAVPLVLLATWALLRWRQSRRSTLLLVLAGLAAGLAGFAKLPALAFVPGLALWLFPRSTRRELGVFLVAAVIGASTVLLYAAYVDWSLFWFTSRIQGTVRPVHPNIFMRYFVNALINMNLVGQGWLVFLWFCFAAETMARRVGDDRGVVVIPALFYLVGVAISAGNWTYGWYWLPLFPMLCLCAGSVMARLAAEPDLPRALMLLALPVGYGLNFVWSLDDLQDSGALARTLALVLCATVLAVFGSAQVWPSGPTRRLARGLVWVLLATFVVLNVQFMLRYDILLVSHHAFDTLPYYSL